MIKRFWSPSESLGFRANLFSVQIIFHNQGSNSSITVWYVFTPAYADIHRRERRGGQPSRRRRGGVAPTSTIGGPPILTYSPSVATITHRWATDGHRKNYYGHRSGHRCNCGGRSVATDGLPWVVNSGSFCLFFSLYFCSSVPVCGERCVLWALGLAAAEDFHDDSCELCGRVPPLPGEKCGLPEMAFIHRGSLNALPHRSRCHRLLHQ